MFALIARFTDTSNYYGAGTYGPGSSADLKIFKKVAGVVTELATSGDDDTTNGDAFKFEIKDATKKLFREATEKLSTTDNALTFAGRTGMGW